MNLSLTGYDNPVTTFVGTLLDNLPELLGAMCTEPIHVVLVAEFSDGRYIQCWSDAFGGVTGEVLSNLNIGDLVALSPDDEYQLLCLGFNEPVEYLSPNWSYEATTTEEMSQLLSMLTVAVRKVLGEGLGNEVKVRTWEIEVPESINKNEVRCEARIYIDKSN
jgi:hypothetical protein